MLRSVVYAAAAVAFSFSVTAYADNVSVSSQDGFINSNSVTQWGVINTNTNNQLGVVNISDSHQWALKRNRNFNTQVGIVNVNKVDQVSGYIHDYNNYSENDQTGVVNINRVNQTEFPLRWRD